MGTLRSIFEGRRVVLAVGAIGLMALAHYRRMRHSRRDAAARLTRAAAR